MSISDEKLYNLSEIAFRIDLHGGPCMGVVIGKKCLGDRENYIKMWKDFAPYVRRPRDVQDVAVAFFEDALHGEVFAGIHWRYDTYDWNDMCKESRPNAAIDRNKQICAYAELLINGDKSGLIGLY